MTRPAWTPGERYADLGQGTERDGSRGDVIVEVSVTVPDTLTPEQEEAMRKFAETMGGNG